MAGAPVDKLVAVDAGVVVGHEADAHEGQAGARVPAAALDREERDQPSRDGQTSEHAMNRQQQRLRGRQIHRGHALPRGVKGQQGSG